MGDFTIIGFFFIGGSVFFEKQERTLGAVDLQPTALLGVPFGQNDLS